jgi:hypothetical protein
MKQKFSFTDSCKKFIEEYGFHNEVHAEKWIINELLTSLILKIYKKRKKSDVRKGSDILWF